jgi:hypothetical protein
MPSRQNKFTTLRASKKFYKRNKSLRYNKETADTITLLLAYGRIRPKTFGI